MTTKTTGAEFKAFYVDKSIWTDGTWHEDQEVTVDNNAIEPDMDYESIPDASIVTITGGAVYFGESDVDGPSFEAFFKRWRKAQSAVFFICEAPKDKADAVKAAIRATGGHTPA